MDFKKDILLVDLEATGLDAQKHEIIQLAAVLLDRKTLKEKSFFNAYIKPAKWRSRDLRSMEVNKIKKEWLDAAPGLKTVLPRFAKKFNPRNVVLAHYGGPVDTDFLRAAFKKLKKPFPYDYHYFNLWALFYGFLAARNKLKNSKKFTGFSLDDFLEFFNIKSENRHDGLADCRLEAEVFRKVMKEMK